MCRTFAFALKAEQQPLSAFWPYLRTKALIYCILTLLGVLNLLFAHPTTPTTAFGVSIIICYSGVMATVYALYRGRTVEYTPPCAVAILLTLCLNIADICYQLATQLNLYALITLLSVGVQLVGLYLLYVLRKKLLEGPVQDIEAPVTVATPLSLPPVSLPPVCKV
ncbi:hypothetical protein B484DRAFT_426413 [Ochromonadaceae sp. CCMP2298]|nr:hypothetical protein B484DRAFT_426413 [Ochromonadaceae sp. CCMP2298]|mmetsp:Transcript_431/g.1090  ORF Transcript_431/g.1090 Transcript_431/m.1090 type:complete len:166 (-) Transcript_431:174-671(-)|eukprot:CAMPEP_0173193578 /NCGR_PEP_ID=MMETSP1141-20130122/14026_1 /TAXON_ID=483371 /ORGANISM="non described non described, Strain CCMP2298" /LENGTH=165 /DNA_ID=CAMNT_0014117909 /DNA_START=40 /DNA_END=537 /DNA_ORIENTATION=+